MVADIAACQGQESARSKPGAASLGLSVDDVIKLAKAGLSEDIILQEIRKRNRPFDLTADQLIGLKAAHVSDRIVVAMLDPTKAEVGASASGDPPELPAAVPTAADPSRAHASKPGNTSTVVEPEAALPTEVGVYANKQGEWMEVSPEIVYWRTAGALKSIATAGVLQGNVNGQVAGLTSRTGLATPLELLVVAPEGTVLGEYQLLHCGLKRRHASFAL